MTGASDAPLTLYGHHWCSHCRKTEAALKEAGANFAFVSATGSPFHSFPTLLCGDKTQEYAKMSVGEMNAQEAKAFCPQAFK